MERCEKEMKFGEDELKSSDSLALKCAAIASGKAVFDLRQGKPEAGVEDPTGFVKRALMSRLSLPAAERRIDASRLEAAKIAARALGGLSLRDAEAAANLAEGKMDLPALEFALEMGARPIGARFGSSVLRGCVYRHWEAGMTACLDAMDPEAIKAVAPELLEEYVGFISGYGAPEKGEALRLAAAPKVLEKIKASGFDFGADLDASGWRPLHRVLAAYGSSRETWARLLLGAGVNVRSKDHAGNEPLHCAAAGGAAEAAKILLAAGADASARNFAGMTAEQSALMKRGASLSEEGLEETIRLLTAEAERLGIEKALDGPEFREMERLGRALAKLAASGRASVELDGKPAGLEDLLAAAGEEERLETEAGLGVEGQAASKRRPPRL